MEDHQSISSTNDPFGLRRNKENTASQQKLRLASVSSSSIMNGNGTSGTNSRNDEQEEISFHYPPLSTRKKQQQRVTIDTGCITEEVSGSEYSHSPTESLLVSPLQKERRPPRSSTTPRNYNSSPSLLAARGGAVKHHSTAAAASPVHQSANHESSWRGDPIQLSYLSPQSDAISQLSASPGFPRAADDPDDGVGVDDTDNAFYAAASPTPKPQQNRDSISLLHNNNRMNDGTSNKQHRTSVTSVATLQQKRMEQLQAELQVAQQEAAERATETTQALQQLQQLEQTHKRTVAALEQAKKVQKQQQQQQLDRNNNSSNHDEKEQELAAWELQLNQQAAALQLEETKVKRHLDDWDELQTQMAELESSHAAEESRLAAWAAQLATLERNHTNEVQTLARRTKGTEKRLDEQALALQERASQVEQREQEVARREQNVAHEKQALLSAAQQLDDKKSRSNAQHQLLQEALDELVQQQRSEEQRLQDAVRQRTEYLEQTEQLKLQNAQEFESLQNQIKDGETTYSTMRQAVEEKRQELLDLTQRMQTMAEADEASRTAANKRIAQADLELTAVVRQLEIAQDQQDAIATELAQMQDELTHVREQMEKEEARWQQQESRLEAVRSRTNEQAKEMLEEARDRVNAMQRKADNARHEAERNLQNHIAKVDRRQADLDDAVHVYKRNVAKLQKDQADCNALCDDLNQRISDHAGRETRACKDLEHKVERLTDLVRTERNQHAFKLKAAVEQEQTKSLDAIASLKQRLEMAESERDKANRAMDRAEKDLTSTQGELGRLREELVAAKDRLNAATNQSDSELDKVKRLLVKLEEKEADLRAKQQDVDNDRRHLQKVEQECQARAEDQDRKEASLFERSRNIQQERLQIEEDSKNRARHLQKAALVSLLSKPWRQERECVSTAFSKWVRTTIFDQLEESDVKPREQLLDMEQHVRFLEEQKEEAQRLEREGIATLERERANKRELQKQLRDAREKEQELYKDIERLSRRQSNDASGTNERESELAKKEANLLQMEQGAQEKEQQIAEANDRIRKLAEMLRQKESRLDEQQSRLDEEKRNCETTQARLQAMISQLEKSNKSIFRQSRENEMFERAS